MLRFRRYRVFLVFAVFTVAALYHFTSVRDWELASVEQLRNYGQQGSTNGSPVVTNAIPEQTMRSTPIADSPVKPTTPLPSTPTVAASTSVQLEDGTNSPASTLSSSRSATSPTQSIANTQPKAHNFTPLPNNPPSTPVVAPGRKYEDALILGGEGRHEPPPPLKSASAIHWASIPDHFPVPSESLIQLPTGRPSSIPKIQHTFGDESSSARIGREQKLEAIKSAFKFSWDGYRRPNSWLQDELLPVSGNSRNPFCGWAATLVDALDTLWIMGMEEEFQQASLAVGEIDFTTSIRNDIPVFETTIRYLGGLLSAYDLSGGKYKVLLTKAVELADVLMGAFDTPNRMPITYYYWKPTYSTNPHRAGTRTVLAEIGSLSVEFTRLAQITKEAKYYDAVARITKEFALWQNSTKIPGLWPTYIDASGCKKSEQASTISSGQMQHSLSHAPKRVNYEDTLKADVANSIAPSTSSTSIAVPIVESPSIPAPTTSPVTATGDETSLHNNARDLSPDPVARGEARIEKRQLAMDILSNGSSDAGSPGQKTAEPSIQPPTKPPTKPPTVQQDVSAAPKVDCELQGLGSPPGATRESFTLGAMADSTYEYLPKQYMLLGGLVPQYKTMYERAIDAASKYLLFRPMIPGDRSILVMGTAMTTADPDKPGNLQLSPEQEHLKCFTGGMYAIGSKLFDRPEDLEAAAKLTDGCVWAYESTATGIMPESVNLIPCENKGECEWNKTRWYEELDPYRSMREQTQKNAQEQAVLRAQEESAAAEAASRIPEGTETTQGAIPSTLDEADEVVSTAGPLAKRQLGNIENHLPDSELQVSTKPNVPVSEENMPATPVETPYHYPTHEEYVEERITSERIPKGMTDMGSRKYILRPEAIESVFIMYRVTGDESWREKGWRMFESIQNHTRAQYGYSAIGDVTVNPTFQLDEMESFWLAETLKYFYLLFSPPHIISLDEYVFNTEAHPFKRPK